MKQITYSGEADGPTARFNYPWALCPGRCSAASIW